MIIDASVVSKWFVPEDDSDRAIALVSEEQLRAPALLMTEIGNTIWKKLRRGELLDRLDIAARLADLRQIVDIVEGRRGELAVRALELAIALDHAIYDGVYLALAEADGDVLLTADDAFRRKVERTDLADHIKGLGA